MSKSTKTLASQFQGETASAAATASALAALRAGARDGESVAERDARRAAQKDRETSDQKLARLTASVFEAGLDNEEGSSTDMNDEEFAEDLQKRLDLQAAQERADRRLVEQYAEAERTGTTGALQEARVKKLSPEKSQGMSMGGSGRGTPTSDAEC